MDLQPWLKLLLWQFRVTGLTVWYSLEGVVPGGSSVEGCCYRERVWEGLVKMWVSLRPASFLLRPWGCVLYELWCLLSELFISN